MKFHTNYNYAYYSCKKLSSYNLKNFTKNKISNSYFEKIIRRANKNQIKTNLKNLNENLRTKIEDEKINEKMFVNIVKYLLISLIIITSITVIYFFMSLSKFKK